MVVAGPGTGAAEAHGRPWPFRFCTVRRSKGKGEAVTAPEGHSLAVCPAPVPQDTGSEIQGSCMTRAVVRWPLKG